MVCHITIAVVLHGSAQSVKNTLFYFQMNSVAMTAPDVSESENPLSIAEDDEEEEEEEIDDDEEAL